MSIKSCRHQMVRHTVTVFPVIRTNTGAALRRLLHIAGTTPLLAGHIFTTVKNHPCQHKRSSFFKIIMERRPLVKLPRISVSAVQRLLQVPILLPQDLAQLKTLPAALQMKRPRRLQQHLAIMDLQQARLVASQLVVVSWL